MRVQSSASVFGNQTRWDAYRHDPSVYGKRLYALAMDELATFERDIWLLFAHAQRRFRLAQNYYMRPGQGFELYGRIIRSTMERGGTFDDTFADEASYHESVMTYIDIENYTEGEEFPRRTTTALHTTRAQSGRA